MPVLANFDQGTTNLGRSPNLWNQSRWDEISDGSNAGFKFYDDFYDFITPGKWTVTQYDSTGTVTDAGLERGVALLDTVSTDSDDGVQMQLGDNVTTGKGHWTPAAGTTIYFEARVALGADIAQPNLFIGMSEGDIGIVAAGINASINHIGFETMTGASVKFYTEKAGNRSDLTGSATACHTWVDGTYVKLGFRVNGITSVDIFVDGVEKTTLQMGAADAAGDACIPIVGLQPAFCIATETTTDPLVYVDWVACLKKYS